MQERRILLSNSDDIYFLRFKPEEISEFNKSVLWDYQEMPVKANITYAKEYNYAYVSDGGRLSYPVLFSLRNYTGYVGFYLFSPKTNTTELTRSEGTYFYPSIKSSILEVNSNFVKVFLFLLFDTYTRETIDEYNNYLSLTLSGFSISYEDACSMQAEGYLNFNVDTEQYIPVYYKDQLLNKYECISSDAKKLYLKFTISEEYTYSRVFSAVLTYK